MEKEEKKEKEERKKVSDWPRRASKNFQTYSVHSATLTATASPGRQRALHHTHVDEDNEAVL